MINQGRRRGGNLMFGGLTAKMTARMTQPPSVTASPLRIREKSTKIEAAVSSYYDGAQHYRQIWGENIHIGFYNNVDNPSLPTCDWNEAQTRLTSMMGKMVGINDQSKVLDLGCGFGQPAVDLATEFGCRVVGVDISQKNIDVCNEIVSQINDAKTSQLCSFELGSFTDLQPNVLRYAPYSHVFTIEAIYHVASQFPIVMQNVRESMENGGLFINCDFLRCDSGPTTIVQNHFYERLALDYLVSPSEMMQTMTEQGFAVEGFLDWSDHAVLGYTQLMEKAQTEGDETLARHYQETWKAFQSRQLVMACVVARKL